MKALRACGYCDVLAFDKNDWGFPPCRIEDFLTSSRQSHSLVTNPPFDLKREFLAQAKRLVRHKIAMLLPVDFEYTVGFMRHHEPDADFAWKAIYAFPQSIRWLNMNKTWGKVRMGWYVFERGYCGAVLREKVLFRRNK